MKRFYFDLETTGFSHHKNAIHQIGAIIEINGVVKEKIDIRMKPFDGAEIEPTAVEVGKVTEQIINGYPEPKKGFDKLIKTLKKYTKKPYDKSLFVRIGFCNIRFDDRFLKALFEMFDEQLTDYSSESTDLYPLVKTYLLKHDIKPDNMKLYSVARALGIEVDESKLHDATYDVDLTRGIHKIITSDEPKKDKSKKRK